MVVNVDQTMIRNPSWWRRRTRLERRVIRVALLLAFINVALVVTIAIILAKRGYKAADRWKNQLGPVCLTPACTATASVLLNDMSLHEDPCNDFYKFTCGGFVEKHTLSEDHPYYDFVTEVEEVVLKQLRNLIEKPDNSTKFRPFTLLRKFYNSCMNTSVIEEKGLSTIKTILNELNGWPAIEGKQWNENRFDWKETMYNLRRLGFDTDFLFSVDVTRDDKNNSRHMIIIDQAVLGTYAAYLENGFKDKIVQAYYNYAVDIAVLLGADRTTAENELKKSVEFEIKLAVRTRTYKDIRNLTAQYNLLTIKELQKKLPQISWLYYINAILGVPKIEVNDDEIINLSAPSYVGKVIDLLSRTPKRVVANYILWRVVLSSALYLPTSFYNRTLEYEKAIDGKKAIPRWKECVTQVSSEMEIAMGALYLRKHCSKAIKNNVIEMVSNIKTEFINILRNLDWMDEVTKKNAIEKAVEMHIRVAYPEELLNDTIIEEYYSKLVFDSENYLEIMLDVWLFNINHRMSQLRKSIARYDWTTESSPNDVNAYYIFEENSVSLNAGILQGVFYNKDRPQYTNYGSLGHFIGHEITHGFDDEGSEYDKDGNLKNWWVESTKDIFNDKARCMIEQYANYSIPHLKINLNGINTQEENIADNGGVRSAYLAYKTWLKKNGAEPQLPGLDFTPSQMFWISVGHTYCVKYRDEYLKWQTETERHSPNPFRVNGPLSNSAYFAKDFNCPAGTKMNPKHKCRVW